MANKGRGGTSSTNQGGGASLSGDGIRTIYYSNDGQTDDAIGILQ